MISKTETGTFLDSVQDFATKIEKNGDIDSMIGFCMNNGIYRNSAFKRVGDICIVEKRYMLVAKTGNCEVVIRTYDKQIKDGVTVDCYIDYGFDIYVFPYSPDSDQDGYYASVFVEYIENLKRTEWR